MSPPSENGLVFIECQPQHPSIKDKAVSGATQSGLGSFKVGDHGRMQMGEE